VYQVLHEKVLAAEREKGELEEASDLVEVHGVVVGVVRHDVRIRAARAGDAARGGRVVNQAEVLGPM
jgi:hypothetical protein